MKSFDTDILTEILAGNPAYAERIAEVPADQQMVPIVAVEEIIPVSARLIVNQAALKTRRAALQPLLQAFAQAVRP